MFRNCLIILKSDSRDTTASIAKNWACGTDTVIRVRRLYRQGGVRRCVRSSRRDEPSRATPEFLKQMKQAVQTNPMTLGYGFANWSMVRLAEHLAKVTGIRFSDDQLRRLLHQEGFSVQRPKHTMKGKRNEAAYKKSKAQLMR